MPFESMTLGTKFLIAALCGASAKTYFDWLRDRNQFIVVIRNFLINCVFAYVAGISIAQAIIVEHPDKEHFAFPLTLFTSALVINVFSALLTINYEKLAILIKVFKK